MDIIKVLRQHADFRRLWISSVLSEAGSALSLVALPLYVIHQSHSYTLAGILVTVGLIGTVVMRIPGGFIADRWPRRLVLMISASIGAVAMSGVSFCVVWHPSFQYWIIGLAWSVNGFVGSAAAVVQSAAVARTLSNEDMQQGFAAWQAQYAATTLIGPLLGGLTFSIAPTLPFAMDAVSFLLELIVLFRIRESLGDGKPVTMARSEVWRGLSMVIQNRFLRVYAVTNGVINVASQGMLYAMVFWMTAKGGTAVGVSFVILALGSLLGSVLSSRLKSHRYQRLLATLVGAYVVAGLAGYLALTPWVAVGALAVASLISQPPSVVLSSHIMMVIPDPLRGRVQGGLFLIGSALYPFGTLITGVVASYWSINGAFAVWGLIAMVSLLVFLIPGWRLAEEGCRSAPIEARSIVP